MPNSLIAAVLCVVCSMGTTVNADTHNQASAEAAYGTVLVYRPQQVKSSRIDFTVLLDKKAERLRSKGFVEYHVVAGQHRLASNLSGTKPLSVNVIAGETVYVQAKMISRRGQSALVLTEVPIQTAFNELPPLEQRASDDELAQAESKDLAVSTNATY